NSGTCHALSMAPCPRVNGRRRERVGTARFPIIECVVSPRHARLCPPYDSPQDRLWEDPMQGIVSLLMMLALALPSIARAQPGLREPAGNAVKMVDYAYSPPRITVTAGTKVSFTNTGSQ